jgi:hypothetical protein
VRLKEVDVIGLKKLVGGMERDPRGIGTQPGLFLLHCIM